MKFLAIFILAGQTLSAILIPLLIERDCDRGKYGYPDFLQALIELGIFVPIFGRILGWW